MRTILRLLLFSLCTFFSSYAQYSSKHYIAPAPWQYWNNANEIVIGTKTPGVTVTVDLYKSDGSFITTLTVTEDNPISYRFEGTISATINNPLETIQTDRGLIIEATHPVMVNLRNIASDAPGSTINNIKGNASLVSFGNEGLGLEFRVGYYRVSTQGLAVPSGNNNPVYSIMATVDHTTVNLPTETITLNEGESYLFTAPIGSLVTASQLVVMNTGSYGDTPQLCGPGGVNGQDGTFDQIAPVHSLGKQYLVVRGEGTVPTTAQQSLYYGPEQTVVVASQPNTTLTITNFSAAGIQIDTNTYTLVNAGDYHTFYHGDGVNPYSSSLIVSSQPVIVYSGTAVTCETDISTVLPIGGCSGAFNVQTKKFINYNNGDLPYFGFTIIESATEPVLLNGVDLETLTGVPRVALGTTGFYLLMFNNFSIGNPTDIILTSNFPLTSSLVQQGDGFSMSAFFSSFGEMAQPPVLGETNDDCSVNIYTEEGYVEYKWYKDGVLIDTTTSSSIIVTENGHYSVQYLKECGYSGISVAVEINIEPCADLSILKTIENEGINTVSFKISVKNNNPYFESLNVIVTDVLPAGYSFVSYTASVGSYDETTGIWEVGNLSPLQEETIVINVTINPVDQYVNTATVTSETLDKELGNNEDSAGIQKTVADVDAIKDDGVEYYHPGDELTYTITIKNNGPSFASNIQVSDPRPEGITQMSWTSSENKSGNGDLTDIIELLMPNESVIYTVKMKVPETFRGDLVNQVYYDSEYYNDPVQECTRCIDINYQYPVFPKGISPNGDNKNDYLDLKDFHIVQLQIFNRLGKVVFTKNLYTDEWHGQADDGTKLPSGTYFFHARSVGNLEFTGYIELIY